MKKKYILTEETIEIHGHIMHRIKAIRDFGCIKKDSLGGWIEKENNMSHYGSCWIDDNAVVCGNEVVS